MIFKEGLVYRFANNTIDYKFRKDFYVHIISMDEFYNTHRYFLDYNSGYVLKTEKLGHTRIRKDFAKANSKILMNFWSKK